MMLILEGGKEDLKIRGKKTISTPGGIKD